MRKQKVKRKTFGITKRFLVVRKIMQNSGIEIKRVRFGKKFIPVARSVNGIRYQRVGKTNLTMLAQQAVWITWKEFPTLRKFMISNSKVAVLSLEQ